MRNLTVFIEGKRGVGGGGGGQDYTTRGEHHSYNRSNPCLLFKSATVYWNYNDVFSHFNNTIRYGSAVITLAERYYTPTKWW